MRRLNGTGTVYKRRTEKKRRNPWVAMICTGIDENGKRINKYIGSFPSAKAAEEALKAFNIDEKNKGHDITFGELWEEVKKHHDFGREYLSVWDNHIHKISSMPINKIKAFHLQNVLDDAKLSGTSQRRIKTIYKSIYKFAIANDIAGKDYSQFVKMDPIGKSDKHHPFTSEEMQLLWAHTENNIFKVVLIQCYTGMRPQEFARIKTVDVHLPERYMIGGMKTEAGINRSIPIAECIFPFVQYFYNSALFKKSDTLLMPGFEEYFYGIHGILNISRIYNKVLPKFGIENHSAHDGRHTFVTMADNYGINETSIKLIVGHSQGGDITRAVYTHKVIPQLIQEVNKLPYGTSMEMYPGDGSGSYLVVTNNNQ